MDRVIYCPSDDFLEEASTLSSKNYLQIIIGDNSHTESLIFDREKVSVVSIPVYRGYTLLGNVKKGFHQSLNYKNEFIIIKNKIQLFVNNKIIKPMYEESHVAKFIFICEEIGDYSCRIVVDGKIEEEFCFVVN
jgi:hypothetical protein